VAGVRFGGLRIEPLRVRVERNRIRFVIFVTAFVVGSAGLLTLAFVAVPGSLIGLVVDEPDYYRWFWIVLGVAFAVALVGGGLAAYAQIANAEHWVRSQFKGGELDPTSQPRLVRAVEEMALAGGLPEPPALLLLHVDSINACAIGATRRSPVIGVTRGLLKQLTVPEQQAVVATLIARITRGDIMVGTGLAALMGPLKYLRALHRLAGDGRPATAATGGTLADGDRGGSWVDACAYSGCEGCGDADGCDLDGDDCGGAILFIVFVVIVAALTYLAVTAAGWLVTFWGRALHRTGFEKADAEGMLLLRDPTPMLSALRKAITSSNEVADGDPSYDGIFYAPTSGRPGIDKVERRRYDRLREVLGVEGLAAELPETDVDEGGETPLADLLDRDLHDLVRRQTLAAGAKMAAEGHVEVLQDTAARLRAKVVAEPTALATFWTEGDRLRWSCTCGAAKTAPCAHLVACAVASSARRPGKEPGADLPASP
jgi:Zn-dependent protease with chaperone function